MELCFMYDNSRKTLYAQIQEGLINTYNRRLNGKGSVIEGDGETKTLGERNFLFLLRNHFWTFCKKVKEIKSWFWNLMIELYWILEIMQANE